MENKQTRLHGIDALRGLTVLSMVAYHFMYDVNIIYGRQPGWYRESEVFLWQQSICWSFIIISGFVWPWGKRKNLRRGLIINLWGLVISAVSYIVMPSEAIWFGVLSFIGCSVLLLIPLDRPLKRLNPWLGLAFSFLLFILLRDLAAGYIAFPGLFRLELPSAIYGPKLLTPLGLPHPGFRSSDYFPMLPWFFLYLCGYFLNGIFNALPWLRRPFTRSIPVLSSLGRRALPIYLLHQPLCMLVCIIIFDFLKV